MFYTKYAKGWYSRTKNHSNTNSRWYSKAIKKLVSPLYKGPASLLKAKGIAVDAPGQIVPEDDQGRGISTVYEVNPRILELKQSNDELKETIKEHFYNDLFAVILNTAERGRTATEVNEVKEEKMVLLSPLLDQVHGAFNSSTLLRLLNQGKYNDAANQFQRWVYANKKVLPGLVKRRAEEKELFVK